MYRFVAVIIGAFAGALVLQSANAETGNPKRGQKVYDACAACHSLESDRNMTGPSLADLWNRKAGTLASFHRYSPALRSSVSCGMTKHWMNGSKTLSVLCLKTR
jgi:cytochrome c